MSKILTNMHILWSIISLLRTEFSWRCVCKDKSPRCFVYHSIFQKWGGETVYEKKNWVNSSWYIPTQQWCETYKSYFVLETLLLLKGIWQTGITQTESIEGWRNRFGVQMPRFGFQLCLPLPVFSWASYLGFLIRLSVKQR